MRTHNSAGQASDSRHLETLLDIGPQYEPRAALDDKGYDSKSNGAELRLVRLAALSKPVQAASIRRFCHSTDKVC
jgi:hypothetical protein